jgi:hypothetical protein
LYPSMVTADRDFQLPHLILILLFYEGACPPEI